MWHNPRPVYGDSGSSIDLHLLERVVARDAAAVTELYDRHSSLLFGVIMRILRSRPDAEEVLQEVFVRVWTRAEMYDGRIGAAAAWLTRIARNRAIDRLRAARARGAGDATPADLGEVGEAAIPSTLPSPEVAAAMVEKGDFLRDALTTLSHDQRTLIEAAFFDGYTHRELADRFGLPLGTVKARIRTGMLALRARLEHTV